MNEQIAKIYDKALVLESNGDYVAGELDPVKFAELIVQRTLDIVGAHTEIFQSDEARAMVEHIKQSVKTDFGVES